MHNLSKGRGMASASAPPPVQGPLNEAGLHAAQRRTPKEIE